MKKWFIAVIVVCMVAFFAVFLCLSFLKGSTVILSSDNFEITDKMIDYYIEIEKNDYVKNYTQKYGNYYLEAAGLNLEKSLKNQQSCYGGTWYEYFKKEVVEDLKTKLLYCEAANKQAIKLDEKTLNETKKKFKNLFSDINKSDLDCISQIEGLSQLYITEFKNRFSPTEQEKDEYYKNNRLDFDCVDYDYIAVKIQLSDNGKENENAKKAKELADKITDSIKKVGFEKTVKLYNIDNDNELFEIKTEMGYRYADTTQFGSWAFLNERQKGDTVIYQSRGFYSIYHIKKTAYPFDYKMKKIQKISFNTKSDKEALEKLEKISERLKNEKNTTDNLLAYAKEMNIGVIENDVAKEDSSINIKEWLYDYEHSMGDYTILEDGLQTSFVRFCGDGGSYFEKQLSDAIFEEKINNNIKKLTNEIKVREHK